MSAGVLYRGIYSITASRYMTRQATTPLRVCKRLSTYPFYCYRVPLTPSCPLTAFSRCVNLKQGIHHSIHSYNHHISYPYHASAYRNLSHTQPERTLSDIRADRIPGPSSLLNHQSIRWSNILHWFEDTPRMTILTGDYVPGNLRG